jgi:uncharacterized protein (DUF433 family)
MQNELTERITINPKIMFGKPVIKGTRLTVQYILGLLGGGMTISDIINEYDGLAIEDIEACILFAREIIEDSTFIPSSEDVLI